MTLISSIQEKYARLQNEVRQYSPTPDDVWIMAVSKYATVEQTRNMIAAGLTLFGENKVQDGIRKKTEVDPNMQKEWHLIGHLQSNKVKKAVSQFDMIQSVDSLALLTKIGIEAQNIGKTMPVLLEINSGEEPQKFGFLPSEIEENHTQLFTCPGIVIMGLMTMGPLTGSAEGSRPYFKRTKKLYERLKSVYSDITILSMGMSADYSVALEEGSTLIRLGSFFIQ